MRSRDIITKWEQKCYRFLRRFSNYKCSFSDDNNENLDDYYKLARCRAYVGTRQNNSPQNFYCNRKKSSTRKILFWILGIALSSSALPCHSLLYPTMVYSALSCFALSLELVQHSHAILLVFFNCKNFSHDTWLDVLKFFKVILQKITQNQTDL